MFHQPHKKSCIPAMTPIEFNILVSLIGADRHGIGIIQAVLERTNQEQFLSSGTLYVALKRLAKAEWIEESEDAPPAKGRNAERRRYYRLSENGVEALIDEIDRMEFVAKEVRQLIEQKKLLDQQDPPSPTGKLPVDNHTHQEDGETGKARALNEVRAKLAKLALATESPI